MRTLAIAMLAMVLFSGCLTRTPDELITAHPDRDRPWLAGPFEGEEWSAGALLVQARGGTHYWFNATVAFHSATQPAAIISFAIWDWPPSASERTLPITTTQIGIYDHEVSASTTVGGRPTYAGAGTATIYEPVLGTTSGFGIRMRTVEPIELDGTYLVTAQVVPKAATAAWEMAFSASDSVGIIDDAEALDACGWRNKANWDAGAGVAVGPVGTDVGREVRWDMPGGPMFVWHPIVNAFTSEVYWDLPDGTRYTQSTGPASPQGDSVRDLTGRASLVSISAGEHVFTVPERSGINNMPYDLAWCAVPKVWTDHPSDSD